MILTLATALLALNFFGHTIILYLIGLYKITDDHKKNKINIRRINLIIPTFNEEKLLEKKISNTKELVEKSKHLIQVYFVDGFSKDETMNILKKQKYLWLKILESEERGKIPQINFALQKAERADYTFISDADSIIASKHAFDRSIEYLENNHVGLVGAWTTPDPETALGIEQAYWDKQNRFRYLETRKCTSSIVTAQFYGFASSFLKKYPTDCIADDVYVSLLCHKKRKKIVYAHDVEAVELRQAKSFVELFFQKLRKANAYTKELLRFSSALKESKNMQRYTILFKYFQFLVLPWVSIIYLFLILKLLIHGSLLLAFASLFIIFSSTLFASLLITPPPPKKRGGFQFISIIHTLIVFSMINTILLINGLIFYFWHPNSKYKRVG